MASIICGECTARHDSVEAVRECYEWAAQPQEVCCRSCDALIGWIDPGETDTLPRYCGSPGDHCKRDFPATYPTY